MELAAGTVVSGRYCVLEALGRGAMAVVYLVRHEQLGTLHALKVLQLPSWSVQRRLLQEGRIQGALKHPNVVGVTDTVEVDGSPGLVMELVRGPGLDRLLQQGRLPLDVARALGVGVLAGVAAAHREGLIHRDLKPANVLVDAAGPALVPRVTDFGLAKLLGPESQGAVATRSGASLGTPAYMAPEQIRDPRSVDQRSDVFALGALLYELVTGRRAFPGDDLLELFRRIDEGRYTPIGVAAPDAPADLAAAIEAALRPDPRERPQGVPELLDRWTSGRGEAVLADVSWDPELLALARELGRVDAAAATLSPSASHTWDLGASALEPARTPKPPPPRPPRRGAPGGGRGAGGAGGPPPARPAPPPPPTPHAGGDRGGGSYWRRRVPTAPATPLRICTAVVTRRRAVLWSAASPRADSSSASPADKAASCAARASFRPSSCRVVTSLTRAATDWRSWTKAARSSSSRSKYRFWMRGV